MSTRHRRTSVARHGDRGASALQRARAAFRESGCEWNDLFAEARREAEIAALPRVEWKGQTLYTLTCAAEFGRGQHQQHVPEYVLWSLIDLRAYRCPYH